MATAKIIGSILLILTGYLIFRARQARRQTPALRSVALLVLGDIGRSPRIMYHAQSFAGLGFQTTLIGYNGSAPNPELLRVPHISFIHLPPPPKVVSKIPFILGAPIKILHQMLSILDALLFRLPPPEFILVQNPPSIPTLALVWLVSRFRSTKVIIDWHNLGYTILALRLGKDHVLVRIAKWFEQFFGRSAYAHLFVTQAMKDYLTKEWGLRGHKVVLHDRPPSSFHRCSPSETHEVFSRLQTSLSSISSLDSFLPASDHPYSTPFTQTTDTPKIRSPRSPPFEFSNSPGSAIHNINMPSLRKDRTALVLSSTSWTADEDFGMLIDALIIYERMAANEDEAGRPGLPKILMIVTGKGPLKAMYMNRVQNLQKEWNWVRCISLWLDAADYPLLLGSADFGICLHSSSSALDLPMKIVDMFGCGLPVCALDFACLNELVKPGLNGLVFKTAEELAGQIVSLLKSFPHSPMLESLRSSLINCASSPSPSFSSFSSSVRRCGSSDFDDGDVGQAGGAVGETEKWEWNTWAENWDDVMKPLILHDVGGYHTEWE